jgi:hypothetical protein
MSLPFLRCAFALLALAFAPFGARAAAVVGLTTIVDGDAVLVREVARFSLIEGVALEAGDIVETGAKTGIVRTELADGTVLDLGPDTRLLLAPRGRGAALGRSGLYILQGWIKLALSGTSAAPPAAAVAIDSPLADVMVLAGVVVERVAADGVTVFQESGQSTVAEPGAPKGSPQRPIKAGETYAWGDGKVSVQPRPDPAFVALLPSAFRDTLPKRAELFRKSPRSPKPLPAPTYADLEPWLTGEPALRAALLPRWQRLAKVPEFRGALIAHRKVHPEWERILFPPPPPPPPPMPTETVAPTNGAVRPSGGGPSPYPR